ncbi:MAG: symmetrical bis(5'-nucleosyl)-tetraphosphatase, partial [Pusillimonas sp.]|nr:symmetrical bis(5'-nucleosyl)-tetraphosphatase [Pusillimonas sp.]
MSPSVWVIGDIQGCCSALDELLEHPAIAADCNAQLWFAGDIVNRGPRSLDTVRRIMKMGSRAITVLGNHDLNLLAVAAGVRKPGKSDTIADILGAPDADEIIEWLRHRPMAHYEHHHLLVHAGVLAPWTLEQTLKLAAEVECALRSKHWRQYLEKMYGNEPNRWRDDLGPNKRLRIVINALTRLRMCDAKGRMDLSYKNAPGSEAPDYLMPWFDVPNRATQKTTIIFGHWSTLGLMLRPDAICLDTGCVWGGKLTALRLSDRQLV